MASTTFSCATCNATFGTQELMRTHYGSEFHVSNVRRRVEGKPAMTTKEYRLSVLGEEPDGVAEDGRPTFACTLCKKTFFSVQTLQAHVRSTAHLIRKEARLLKRDGEQASMLSSTSLGSAAMGLHHRHKAKQVARNAPSQSKKGTVSAEEREADATALRCMFCGRLSDTVAANVDHLKHAHSFAIPMEAHCINVEGFLEYLARKVNGLICLTCNEKSKSFGSLGALRGHMEEKQHDTVILNSEYAEFYDCALEDGQKVVTGERGGALVVPASGKKSTSDEKKMGAKVIHRKESEVPKPRKREDATHMEQRSALAIAEKEEKALQKKEQKKIMASQNEETKKLTAQKGAAFQKEQLRTHLRSNKLHPYGYDGSGI